MEVISFEYTKQRKDFGRRPAFGDTTEEGVSIRYAVPCAAVQRADGRPSPGPTRRTPHSGRGAPSRPRRLTASRSWRSTRCDVHARQTPTECAAQVMTERIIPVPRGMQHTQARARLARCGASQRARRASPHRSHAGWLAVPRCQDHRAAGDRALHWACGDEEGVPGVEFARSHRRRLRLNAPCPACRRPFASWRAPPSGSSSRTIRLTCMRSTSTSSRCSSVSSSRRQRRWPSLGTVAAGALSGAFVRNTLVHCRDPNDKKRAATRISWHPDGSLKIAVSYAVLQFQQARRRTPASKPRSLSRQAQTENLPTSSYIWDVKNPNQPEFEVTAPSPLCWWAPRARTPAPRC
jgi:hypothetical protein